MKKTMFVLSLSLLGVFLLTGCGANQITNQTTNQAVNENINQPINEITNQAINQPVNEITNQTPVTPETKTVSIENFAFNPAELVIKTGTTVKWTNNDSVQHQIKSTTFNSTLLKKGDTFEFKFETVGSYDYSCAIHSSMKGKITVE